MGASMAAGRALWGSGSHSHAPAGQGSLTESARGRTWAVGVWGTSSHQPIPVFLLLLIPVLGLRRRRCNHSRSRAEEGLGWEHCGVATVTSAQSTLSWHRREALPSTRRAKPQASALSCPLCLVSERSPRSGSCSVASSLRRA